MNFRPLKNPPRNAGSVNPFTTFEAGIKKTIEWYLSEQGSQCLEECMAQNATWLEKNYKNR